VNGFVHGGASCRFVIGAWKRKKSTQTVANRQYFIKTKQPIV